MKILIKILILFVFFHLSSKNSRAQEEEKKEFYVSVIGFYNLENLFDTLDSEDTRDSEFTPGGEKKWNSEKYNEKLQNMAKVISELGTEVTPDGPAILGICEIENRSVVEDLVKTPAIKDKDYRIVHHDSPDERGIDVGLIYQPKYFEVTSSNAYKLELEDDFTRDQLLVSGKFNGEPLHVIVAHWPSRSGGEKRSRPGRIAAAKLGRSIIDSIQKSDPAAKIIYMGDLNDDPVNKSVNKHLNAKREIKNEDELFNPMNELYRKGIGTLAWRDNWNLFDQIIMTPSLTEKDYSSFRYYGAKVFNKNYLKQSSGSFKGYPFRTYVGSRYMGGYSDHFPVYIFLVKEKR